MNHWIYFNNDKITNEQNLPIMIAPNCQALREVKQHLSRKTDGFEAVQGILLVVYY